MKSLKPKALQLFNNLLDIFNDNQIEPKIEFASPNSTYKETRLNSIHIHKAVCVISQGKEQITSKIEINGVLTVLSYEKPKFELRSESAELISGKIVTSLEKRIIDFLRK